MGGSKGWGGGEGTMAYRFTDPPGVYKAAAGPKRCAAWRRTTSALPLSSHTTRRPVRNGESTEATAVLRSEVSSERFWSKT